MSSFEPPKTSEPDTELNPGEMVDYFNVIKLIGKGGMGAVYLARDMRLGRKVALKLIKSSMISTQSDLERFMYEARITARFSHPNIVTLHAFGEFKGVPYFAMEYLDGENLASRLKREKLGLWDAVRIGISICEALAEAHKNNIYHRDLKPENIFIPSDGRLKILDFGLARYKSEFLSNEISTERGLIVNPGDVFSEMVTSSVPSMENTDEVFARPPSGEKTGTTRGTPPYMAPELWMGEDGDDRTDVFALGIIMYEMLTGKRPFNANSLYDLALEIVTPGPVKKPSELNQEVPASLDDIVMMCLERKKENRPDSAQILGLLQGILGSRDGTYQGERSPFRGLSPFYEENSRFFFGREDEILQFLERMRSEAVLPVIGHSGAGKSSFVRAGVIPRLRERGNWRIFTMQPGRNPWLNLKAALAGFSASENIPETSDKAVSLSPVFMSILQNTGENILLFIDQFEELFTGSVNSTHSSFADSVLSISDDPSLGIRVVFTIRDDYLGKAAERIQNTRIFNSVTVIKSPGIKGLLDIVTRPLKETGYTYDDPLLPALMVKAVENEESPLPVLQFVTGCLWEQRDRKSKLLLRKVYDSTGGVEGALATHADEVVSHFPAESLKIVKSIFLMLFNTDRTRKVCLKSEITAGNPVVEEIVNTLVNARLLSVRTSIEAEPEIETVHESLVRTWKTLDNWLSESRYDHIFYDELKAWVRLWTKNGKTEEGLWTGKKLDDAVEFMKSSTLVISDDVNDFIERCKDKSLGDRRRRKMIFGFSFLTLFIIALVSVVVAMAFAKEKNLSEQARRRESELRILSENQEKAVTRQWAQAQLEGAQSALERGDVLESRSKLRMAAEKLDDAAAALLLWKLNSNPLQWKKDLGASVYETVFSPDGKHVAAACLNKNLYVFNVLTRAATLLRGHTEQVLAVSFSPDKKHIASGSYNGMIIVHDLQTGKIRFSVKPHSSRIRALRYMGDVLVSSGVDGRISRISATGKILKSVTVKGGGYWSMAISDKGHIYAGHESGEIHIYNPELELIRKLKVASSRIADIQVVSDSIISISSGGSIDINQISDFKNNKKINHRTGLRAMAVSDGRIHVCDDSGMLTVYSIKNLALISRLKTHDSICRSVDINTENLVVSGGSDNFVRMWKFEKIESPEVPRGHRSSVVGLAFSPDDSKIVSGGGDGSLIVWNTQTGEQIGFIKAHKKSVMGVAWSPDGRYIASASTDSSVKLWKADDLTPAGVFEEHRRAATQVEFSPDSRMLLSAGFDRRVILREVPSGKVIHVLEGHKFHVWTARFSPDGRFIASGSNDKTVRIWDVFTGKNLKTFNTNKDSINGLTFHRNGKIIYAGDDSRHLFEIDLELDTVSEILRMPSRLYWIDYSPKSDLLLVSSANGFWHQVEGRRIKTSRRYHRSEVNAVTFSRTGKYFASSGDDSLVRVYSTLTDVPLWRLSAVLPDQGRWYVWPPKCKTSEQNLLKKIPALAKDYKICEISDDHGTLLCCDGNNLHFYDFNTGKKLLERKSSCNAISPLGNGFAVLSDGKVVFHSLVHSSQIKDDIRLLSSDGQHMYVFSGSELIILDTGLKKAGTFNVGLTCTSALYNGNVLVTGHSDGTITSTQNNKVIRYMEGTPSSSVTSISRVRSNILSVGFADGSFGLWNIEDGKRLYSDRIHGTIAKQIYSSGFLHVYSDTGFSVRLDLRVLEGDQCSLLCDIWKRIPVIRRGLDYEITPPDKTHPCFSRCPIIQRY